MPNKQEAVVLTGVGITYAQYAVAKQRLKLESKGLKFYAGATRPKLAAQFGLKPRDSFETYIKHCETKMNELLDVAAMQRDIEAGVADELKTNI